MSKDAYWFRHESNANRDPKIMMLKSVYGFEGYGLYWAIIEALREQEGYRIKVGGKFGFMPLSGIVQYDAVKFEEFVKDCINEFELFQIKGDYLECKALVDRMKKWEANKANGAKGGRPKKPKLNPTDNPNGTQTKPNPKPTEKPRETIEIIVDKIIEDNSIEEESTDFALERFPDGFEPIRKQFIQKYGHDAESENRFKLEKALLTAINLAEKQEINLAVFMNRVSSYISYCAKSDRTLKDCLKWLDEMFWEKDWIRMSATAKDNGQNGKTKQSDFWNKVDKL